MKFSLLLLLLVISGNLIAQGVKHQIIPGTKCSLVPPDDFAPATNFSGFQHPDLGASIMISEMPAPYSEILDGFSAASLLSQGMTLIEQTTAELQQTKAVIFYVSQQGHGTTYFKQILLFGDSIKTILVIGVYPEASKGIEPAIKAALLSSIYDPNQNADPLSAAGFAVDVSGTDFVFAKYISGSLVYTADGQFPTENASVIAGASVAKTVIENKQQFSIERLKKMPNAESVEPAEILPVTIDGLSGYAITGYQKKETGEEELFYQVLLFNDTGDYYIIMGMSAKKNTAYLEQFKRIAQSFRRK